MPSDVEAVRPVNALVPLALHNHLRQVAKEQSRSLAYILRAALSEYVERHSKPRQEVAKD
jgi:predicted transcriptional regulator